MSGSGPFSDAVAHLGHHPQALMDATEVRVRRPVAGRAGRDRFVSGKALLNTMKALVICDPLGRLLFCGETRPGTTPGESEPYPLHPKFDEPALLLLPPTVHEVVRTRSTVSG
ncbi:transposase family protein [Micromonospora pallida]|uniref:transposase family protein n=1 Tax=Micromonospora pallida TaxID=145854 RepID=UPI001FE1DE7D|nr:transposase family protein [Micromonospora pallida]